MSAQELASSKNADSSDMKPREGETIDNVNVKVNNANNNTSDNANDNLCNVVDKLSQLTGTCHSRHHSTNQPRTM